MVKDTSLSSAVNCEHETPLVPPEFDLGSITFPDAVERGTIAANASAEITRLPLSRVGISAAIALGTKVIAIQKAQTRLKIFLDFFLFNSLPLCNFDGAFLYFHLLKTLSKTSTVDSSPLCIAETSRRPSVFYTLLRKPLAVNLIAQWTFLLSLPPVVWAYMACFFRR